MNKPAVPAKEFKEPQNGAKGYSPGSGNPGRVTQPWVKKMEQRELREQA